MPGYSSNLALLSNTGIRVTREKSSNKLNLDLPHPNKSAATHTLAQSQSQLQDIHISRASRQATQYITVDSVHYTQSILCFINMNEPLKQHELCKGQSTMKTILKSSVRYHCIVLKFYILCVCVLSAHCLIWIFKVTENLWYIL